MVLESAFEKIFSVQISYSVVVNLLCYGIRIYHCTEIRAGERCLEECGFNSKFQAMLSSQQASWSLAGTMAPSCGHNDLYLEGFPLGHVSSTLEPEMIDIG